MSVYTKISKDALTEHLKNYSVGEFVSVDGISDGIENTNYLLRTSSGEYIFTIWKIEGFLCHFLKYKYLYSSLDFREAPPFPGGSGDPPPWPGGRVPPSPGEAGTLFPKKF